MPRIRVVLVGTEGEINLGMIARLTDNFNADELYLVSPQADLEGAKEYAVHAAYRLDEAVIVDNLESALKGASFTICTTAVSSSGGDILRVTTPLRKLSTILERIGGTIAVVFGRESVGLTREELSMCDTRVTIETSEKYRTMNLACSVAVVLYTLHLHAEKMQNSVPVSARKKELALSYAKAIAGEIFGDHHRRAGIELLFRKMLASGILEEPEASLLLTFLSRIHSRITRIKGGKHDTSSTNL